MKKPSVPDRKQLQQRRWLIDEEFKKQKIELSDHGVKDEQIKMCEKKTVKFITTLELSMSFISRSQQANPCCNEFYCLDEMEAAHQDLALYCFANQVSNHIGNKGCKNLSKMISPTLTHLYLNNNQIDSSGVAHLSKSQWPKLDSIILYHNKIGEEGIDYLLKSNWMNLKQLHLCWNDTQRQKKVWLVLGSWRKIKVIGLLEEEENEFSGLVQASLLRQKYPKVDLDNFTTIGLYDTA